jgi:hypothetical protein
LADGLEHFSCACLASASGWLTFFMVAMRLAPERGKGAQAPGYGNHTRP